MAAPPFFQKYRLKWPWSPTQVANVDQMFQEIYTTVADVQRSLLEVSISAAGFGDPLPPAHGGTGTSTLFTAGSVIFAGASGVYSQNNAKFFWDNGSFVLRAPRLAGSATAGDQLLFYGTFNASGNTTPFKWATNTDGSFQMALFSNGTLCVAGSGVTPTANSLGSGGTFLSAIHNTASGGVQAASNSITNGTDIGYIDFGTFGTASSEKRVGAIHGFLTADATASPTGELRFYTTTAGSISEKLAITNDGRIRFNSNRAKFYSPADSQITFTSNNEATGFGIQMGTANTMIVANKAQNAYGTVDCLGLKASGTPGANATLTGVTVISITVVNGIVTACTSP